MALGNLLRKAADMTDTAVNKATEAYDDVKERVRGDGTEASAAYEEGVNDLVARLQDLTQRNNGTCIFADVAALAAELKHNNPHV